MNGTIPRRPRRPALDELAAEAGRCQTWTDETTSELQHLIVALEEVLFAPWWRRPAVRRRWRRDVAASIRCIQGGDFTEKRGEAIGSGWVSRPGGPHEVRVHWGEKVTWPRDPGRGGATAPDQHEHE